MEPPFCLVDFLLRNVLPFCKEKDLPNVLAAPLRLRTSRPQFRMAVKKYKPGVSYKNQNFLTHSHGRSHSNCICAGKREYRDRRQIGKLESHYNILQSFPLNRFFCIFNL